MKHILLTTLILLMPTLASADKGDIYRIDDNVAYIEWYNATASFREAEPRCQNVAVKLAKKMREVTSPIELAAYGAGILDGCLYTLGYETYIR